MHIVSPAKAFLLIAVSTLSACEFGDDGSGTSYSDISAEVDRLTEVTENDVVLETADIPTMGTASYLGVLALVDTSNTRALMGQTQIDVAFETDSVTGTVNDFVYAEDVSDQSKELPSVDGTLTFENGFIDRTATSSDPQILTELTGTLNAPVDMFGIDANTDIDLQSDFEGVFGEESVSGYVSGTIEPASGATVDVGGVILTVEE
ncbi:hypothetical protein CLV80_11234 [Yoonia maritima]|uniref:Transferrin-binding protein B C-lobe/N-lobe beta barrel domain-containing protein n=1 Tax=Yoonia maritima TaxID=1435347 RepID=A0A2T0VV23_9RHOB|nr:hypothetical protein [Yoonia maritima]PRY75447.1 hypothetical protein CLV80_11234 [Yoonia maritima]